MASLAIQKKEMKQSSHKARAHTQTQDDLLKARRALFLLIGGGGSFWCRFVVVAVLLLLCAQRRLGPRGLCGRRRRLWVW
jgi:hypothetical protein